MSARLNTFAARYLGCLWILLGIAFNPITIGWFSPDGGVNSSSFLIGILLPQAAMILSGVIVLRKQPRGSVLLALSSSAILVTLLSVEVVAIYTGLLVPPQFLEKHTQFFGFLRPDRDLGFRGKPDLRGFVLTSHADGISQAYDTDALGFRNVGRDYQSAKLFVIGDSFSFGPFVDRERTFYGLIESSLSQPVISLGLMGYGFPQYRRLMETLVACHDPPLVALCVYANDLRRMLAATELHDYYRTARWDEYRQVTYRDKSLIPRVGNAVVGLLRKARGHGPNPVSHRIPNGLMLFRSHGANDDFPTVEPALREIIEMARAWGTRLIIFLLPSKESVYFEEFQRAFSSDDCVRCERSGFELIGRVAAAENVCCIDLTPTFREHARTGKVAYFHVDGHWNELGNRIAAEAMLPHLRDLLDLDSP